VVLAREHEGLDHARAVDRVGDLVGVLGDDREEVGQQLALDRGQVGRDVGRQDVRVIGAVDGTVPGDRDRLLLVGGGQAACGIVALVRYRSPSSSLRW
jgi:hypothetical protein